MSGKYIVDALNKESIRAIRTVLEFIGIPTLITIGGLINGNMSDMKADQKKFFATQEIHTSRLTADSTALVALQKEDLKLHRFDQLSQIKQDAAKDALRNNSQIGIEFLMDYDKKYSELAGEYSFLNP